MTNSSRFLWPHENRKLMQERISNGKLSSLSLLQRTPQIINDISFASKCVMAFLGFGSFRKFETKIMQLFNGQDTTMLNNKYKFLELCLKLGYQIPKQILITGSESLTEKKLAFEEAFKNNGYGFFIKPESGFNGKGIKVLSTKGEVLSILDEIKNKCVIEEAINIDKEFRYILYDDPDGNKWHLIFEKIRSRITGDGKSRIATLILKNNTIPLRRKLILFRKKFKLLNIIPAKGERVQLENTCSYGRLPSETEVSALDKFVPKLILDLEKNIGHKLPILCFDLGITTPLKSDMEFEELKKIITPFECQLPFSPLAHFKFMKNSLGPFIDFYRMLIVDMIDTVNKRMNNKE